MSRAHAVPASVRVQLARIKALVDPFARSDIARDDVPAAQQQQQPHAPVSHLDSAIAGDEDDDARVGGGRAAAALAYTARMLANGSYVIDIAGLPVVNDTLLHALVSLNEAGADAHRTTFVLDAYVQFTDGTATLCVNVAPSAALYTSLMMASISAGLTRRTLRLTPRMLGLPPYSADVALGSTRMVRTRAEPPAHHCELVAEWVASGTLDAADAYVLYNVLGSSAWHADAPDSRYHLHSVVNDAHRKQRYRLTVSCGASGAAAAAAQSGGGLPVARIERFNVYQLAALYGHVRHHFVRLVIDMARAELHVTLRADRTVQHIVNAPVDPRSMAELTHSTTITTPPPPPPTVASPRTPVRASRGPVVAPSAPRKRKRASWLQSFGLA